MAGISANLGWAGRPFFSHSAPPNCLTKMLESRTAGTPAAIASRIDEKGAPGSRLAGPAAPSTGIRYETPSTIEVP